MGPKTLDLRSVWCHLHFFLSQSNNIEMPICDKVYKVLFTGTSPRDAILELMGRELVNEYSI